ncbi:MAG: hypothetical protein ACLUQ6_07980 [Alistipes onderdonkii]
MKKIVSILSTIFLLSATLSSCTDLEENPYSSIPSDEFFNNEEEFLMSAGRIYAYLVRYTCYRCIWGTISVSTDEAVSPLREGNQWVDDGVWRDMHAHTWNSQMQDLQTIWEFLFGGISLCNQILWRVRPVVGRFRGQTQPGSRGAGHARMVLSECHGSVRQCSLHHRLLGHEPAQAGGSQVPLLVHRTADQG